MSSVNLAPRFTPSARVEEIERESSHYLLSIPSGKANQYRLTQLDDYAPLSRKRFPHRSPFHMSLDARVSSNAIPGTWGFGLWNNPFGLSLGFGGNPWSLPALPNAVWFFGASEENYLSFKSASTTDRKSRSSAQREQAVNGFLAQTFRAPNFHPLLIPAGLVFPFSRKATRKLLGQVIKEDAVQLQKNLNQQDLHQQADAVQRLDLTQWHRYSFEWSEKRVAFEVDEVQVFESSVSPNPPLGLVIWIDNQYAAFRPGGKLRYGVLENPEPAWLEIKDLNIK